MIEDKDFEYSNMTVRVPRHISKSFRQVIRDEGIYSDVHEALASYMIKTVGEYNKECRESLNLA